MYTKISVVGVKHYQERRVTVDTLTFTLPASILYICSSTHSNLDLQLSDTFTFTTLRCSDVKQIDQTVHIEMTPSQSYRKHEKLWEFGIATRGPSLYASFAIFSNIAKKITFLRIRNTPIKKLAD